MIKKITKKKAEELLIKDLEKFETGVNLLILAKYRFNQNEFDALVSFTYNCGPGSLQSLVKGRTKPQVANRMMVYTHSGSEAYTAGLYNRRKKEKALFLEPVEEDDDMERWQKISDVPSGYYRDQVRRLIEEGVLAGTSEGLNLTEDMLRTILIAERAAKKAVGQS